MEPGGIEPPSRDSQQDASTRVSGDLISVPRAATGRLPLDEQRRQPLGGRIDGCRKAGGPGTDDDHIVELHFAEGTADPGALGDVAD